MAAQTKMTIQEVAKYFRAAVENHPRQVHDYIHQHFPGEFTKYTNGAESKPGQKTAMVRFLVEKAEKSGNYEDFIKSF